MSTPLRFHSRRRAAFTLVEILVVLAIISILSALTLYSIQGLLGSNSLSGAGQHLEEIVSLARQSAITHSRVVELRVYQQKAGTDFNGYRLVLLKPDLSGIDQSLTKPQFFPAGIVISGTTPNLSAPTTSLLGVNPPLQIEPLDGTITSGLSYASVRFNASGGLKDVSASASYYYYLLVVQQNGAATNKVVLSVDPVSGITQYSRP